MVLREWHYIPALENYNYIEGQKRTYLRRKCWTYRARVPGEVGIASSTAACWIAQLAASRTAQNAADSAELTGGLDAQNT